MDTGNTWIHFESPLSGDNPLVTVLITDQDGVIWMSAWGLNAPGGGINVTDEMLNQYFIGVNNWQSITPGPGTYDFYLAVYQGANLNLFLNYINDEGIDNINDLLVEEFDCFDISDPAQVTWGYNGCTDSTACNYDSTATCDDGSCTVDDACGVCGGTGTVAGCTDSTACNYDSLADCDDGSCVLPDGCTDSTACNYDSTAACDDGSCEFASCACPGDFNENGVIGIFDLLYLLAQFGCTSDCTADLTGDGEVNSQDLLAFLPLFGTTCP